jgi:transposase
MPVYPFPGRSASSCTSPGCLCRDRRPAYPSDTTDEQWRVLRPEAETVMAGLVLAAGRPMVHDLRAMLDAVFYVARNGVEWRALPADFPPHAAVYKFFERWSQRELPETLVHRLRRRLRVHQGRDGEPTAVIVDSQIVKAADTVGKDSRGFHGGKKINGRGRHAAVDAEGWLLSVVVTGAQVSDRAGAKLLAISLLNALTTLKIMWADSGYDGKPLAIWMKQAAGLTLQIIKRSDKPGFQVVSRRWVVERTFGWLLRYRRLVRDYERRPAHHEAMVYWATIMIMTRRLARYETGIAPVRRWGGDRSHPSPKQDQQVA